MQPAAVVLALAYACVVNADTSASHKQMADSAIHDLIASIPVDQHEKLAADLHFVGTCYSPIVGVLVAVAVSARPTPCLSNSLSEKDLACGQMH